MNVRQILSEKVNDFIASARTTDTVAAAAEQLASRRIGALVVSDDDTELAGIVSERDLVRALAQEGSVCLDQPVSGFMTRDVVCASPADSLDKVLAVMTRGRFRHMPVMEDGKLVGMISIGDAVKARIAGLEQENAALAEWIKSG